MKKRKRKKFCIYAFYIPSPDRNRIERCVTRSIFNCVLCLFDSTLAFTVAQRNRVAAYRRVYPYSVTRAMTRLDGRFTASICEKQTKGGRRDDEGNTVAIR